MRLVVFSVIHLIVFFLLYCLTDQFILVPPLFSFNYMILNIGISSFMLVFYYILEVYTGVSFSPIHQVGKNLLFIMFLANILQGRWPFGFANSGSHSKAMLSAGIGMSVWLGFGWLLGRYKFYFKF